MRLSLVVSSIVLAIVALACVPEDPEATSSPVTTVPGVAVTTDAGTTAIGITTSPLTLTPAFSPTIEDYYVRCAAGDNPVTLTVTSSDGDVSTDLVLEENQAVVVQGEYWIRCLPHDFPVITVKSSGAGPTPGYYLVNSATYAVVLDTNGTPVWCANGSDVANVDAPAVDTISFSPNSTSPFGTSLATTFQIEDLDTSAATSVAAVGGPTDAHELQHLVNGDVLLFTYPIETNVDLSGLSTFTSDESMADCEIQEISPTGALVWSWLASDHIDPLLESLEPSADVDIDGVPIVDVFHCNSIDVDASGNLLLSVRHANAVFYIDKASGQIVWKLGGTAYNHDGAALISVQGDPETTFAMQHDARFQANGDVSVFDDHGVGIGKARGVEYAIDHTSGVATVEWQFVGISVSAAEGSFRRYSDGESVIDWGYNLTDLRVVTELDANGNDVFDVAFSTGNPSYRAVKVPLSQLSIGALRATAGK